MSQYEFTRLDELGDVQESYHVTFANGRRSCMVYHASSFAEVERFLRNHFGVSDDARNGGVPAVANGDQNERKPPIGMSLFEKNVVCIYFRNPGEILMEAIVFEKSIIPSKDPCSKNLLQKLLSGVCVKVVFDLVSVKRFFQHDVRYDLKNAVDLEEESTVQLLIAKKKKRIPFFQTSERNLKHEIILSELIGLKKMRIPILAEKCPKLHLQAKKGKSSVNTELVMKVVFEAYVSFEVARRIRIPVNDW